MMKKYWRKMMALTCAAAMLFTMAGCGNAEGTTGGAETAQSSTTADGSGEITIQFAEHVADIQAQEPHLQKIITRYAVYNGRMRKCRRDYRRRRD